MAYRFHNTKHVCDRHGLRDFSFEKVRNTVNYYEDKKLCGAGPHGGKKYRFEKDKFVVIAEIKDNECWLVTAYET